MCKCMHEKGGEIGWQEDTTTTSFLPQSQLNLRCVCVPKDLSAFFIFECVYV